LREKTVFNCAKVYRGWYVSGTNEQGRAGNVDFTILNGEAKIIPYKPVRVNDDAESRLIKSFLIYPITNTVDLLLKNARGSKNITLKKSDGYGSRMCRQKP